MKTLATLLLLFISSLSYSQSIKRTADGNYIAVAKQDSTQAKNTLKTYTDTKGNVYQVWISKNGKLFIKRISKTTNKEYKQYLTL